MADGGWLFVSLVDEAAHEAARQARPISWAAGGGPPQESSTTGEGFSRKMLWGNAERRKISSAPNEYVRF